MDKLIDNLKIDNEKFAKIVEEEHLVLRRDILFEIAAPVSVAVTMHIDDASLRTIMSARDFKKCFKPVAGMHFIYNGEIFDEEDVMYSDISKSICSAMERGAFTIGICTSNDKEYEDVRSQYKTFKTFLEGLGITEVGEIERESEGHKAYLLTYRRK